MTALILVLAANTAFNGFPVLASILAQDRYMPRQMHNRGDRLVFSNGIVLLALFAGVLIYAFHAQSTKLIQLYIVGVFVSFTLQPGRHGPALEPAAADADRPRAERRRHACGAGRSARSRSCTTGTVLVVVLVTKFLSGAWIAIVAMIVLWFLMQGIHRHYRRCPTSSRSRSDEPTTLPVAGALDRPGLQDAPADPAGAGVRPRDPAVDPRGAHGRDRPRRGQGARRRSGSGGRSRCR